jgi:hypothetical protein
MTTISYNGEEFDFAKAEAVMEPGLRRTLLERMGACSAQELLDAYAAAHLAIYGDEFFIPE